MTAIGHAWVALTQSFAIIALALTALGLMLGMVKPASVLSHVAAIVGVVVALILIPVALVDVWAEIPFLQRVGLVAIGVGIWRWRRARWRTPQKKGR